MIFLTFYMRLRKLTYLSNLRMHLIYNLAFVVSSKIAEIVKCIDTLKAITSIAITFQKILLVLS